MSAVTWAALSRACAGEAAAVARGDANSGVVLPAGVLHTDAPYNNTCARISTYARRFGV
jgi:hypothetical protein